MPQTLESHCMPGLVGLVSRLGALYFNGLPSISESLVIMKSD